jgi:MFS family permease
VSELEPEQILQELDQELPQQPGAMGVEGRRFRLPRPLAAFGHRNYALFFSGQLVSLTGTWLQQVAQGWLVIQLVSAAHRALMVGIVSAISALPILMLSLYAGSVIDRLNKRNLLVVTQTSAMVLAFALAALTHSGLVTIYYVIVIGFLLGVSNAFDAPTRQSFVIEMVGREDLSNAIATNSFMFNGARIFGPAVAGKVIAYVGLAGAFFLNGVSFIAVIIGLLLMKLKKSVPALVAPTAEDRSAGLRFIRSHKTVGALIVLAAMVSIFATPYAVLMPVFAHDILKVGVADLGSLMMSVGIGALTGALTLMLLGDIRHKGRVLLMGNLIFCSMLICFSFTRSLRASELFLIGTGWGMMLNMALTNTLIQISVPNALRGRVMSVYTLMFMGMTPVGGFQAGVVAHYLGVSNAVRIGAILCGLAALVLSPRFVNHVDETNRSEGSPK